MSNLFWLTDAQMSRLQPFFPKSHGKPRVDDRRVLSGIIFINRNGLRWCDAPKAHYTTRNLRLFGMTIFRSTMGSSWPDRNRRRSSSKPVLNQDLSQ